MVRENPKKQRLEIINDNTKEVVAWISNEERQLYPQAEQLFFRRYLGLRK
jgi:hypothetical protein